ncbi:hypothetical protein AGMMS50256_22260 [Betaproteobacteria bacterium]|nr:hypothetical protein AGMMS50256_22260 [Betaproteobacteria bacterium]
MQLDLFEHSQDVVLRNAVVDAVKRRDADGGKAAIAALAVDYADDPLLPDMETLCRHMEAGPLPSVLSATDAAMLLQDAEGRLEPAARRLLGTAAEAWFSTFWLALANAIAGLSFDPRTENLHAAPLCLRAGDWPAAIAAIEGIPSWRRQPIPLCWMIDARFHADGLEMVWPLIMELAWMAPRRASLLLPRLADLRLARLVRRFNTEFEDSDTENGFAWFPAWLLIEDGSFADKLKLAEQGRVTPPERCARLVMTLLSLERQGRHAEVVDNRRQLREVNGTLFAMYMQSR